MSQRTHKLIYDHSPNCPRPFWFCVAHWKPTSIAQIALGKLAGFAPYYLGDSIGRRGNGHTRWELYVCNHCESGTAYVNAEVVREVVHNTIERAIGKERKR